MEVGGQHYTSSTLPFGINRYPLCGSSGGSQGWPGWVQKTLPPLGFGSRTIKPVASCYTDHCPGPCVPFLLKIYFQVTMFWSVTPISSSHMYRHLGGTCCFQLLPWSRQQQIIPKVVACVLHCIASYSRRVWPLSLLPWKLKSHVSYILFSCVIGFYFFF